MTYREAFNRMQEPYGEQALRNIEECYIDSNMNQKMSDCLRGGFDWEDTPEGFDYWHKYFNELKNLGL